MTISELKKDAKTRLKGKMGKAFGIMAIYFIISFLLQLIGTFLKNQTLNIIYQIVILIVTFPFSYGILASMIKLSRNEEVVITDFINIGLQNLCKIWGILGLTIIKLLLPTILYVVSIIVCSLAIASANSAGITLITAVIMICIMIYYIAKTLSYILSSYILFDEGNLSSKEIVEKSNELMKGNKGKYILLGLSFIGWFLLIYAFAFVIGILGSILGVVGAILGFILMAVGAFILSIYIEFTFISFYEDLNSYTETTVVNEVIE